MALNESSIEATRIALSGAGPIPNAVLYNNGKDLWAAIVASGADTGGGGGGGGTGYYGAFYDALDQPIAVINTPYPVYLRSTWGSNAISVAGGTAITMAYAGTYTFTFVAQVSNLANSVEDAIFWIKYNGVDFPNSATRLSLQPRKSSGQPSTQLATVSITGTAANAGDIIQLYWQATSTSVSLQADPVSTYPESPSVIASIVAVSGVINGAAGPAGAQGVPVGTIIHTGGAAIPPGYLDCNGASVLRTAYADLFAAIGTTFGDGTIPGTTFALPTVVGTYGNFAICANAAEVVVETQSLIGAPVGMLQLYAGSVYPTGWMRADGSAISRTTYADLFAIIGTTYGSGDGSTTFNLPNLASSGTGSPVYIIKAILSGSVEPSTVAHASSHIRAGTDVIDGDRVQIDYVPTRYVRNAAAAGAGAVTDLTAHLDGVNTLAGQGHIVCTSSTRPASPATGTMIYETDTGFIVVYNGTSWVQMMSPSSPPGMVIINPTSVVNATNSSGSITFSNVASISVNGVFSNQFTNYKIIGSISNPANVPQNAVIRMRSSGTDNTSAVYTKIQQYSYPTTGPSRDAYNNLTYAGFCSMSSTQNAFSGDVMSPFAAMPTYGLFLGTFIASSTSIESGTFQWTHNANSSFDGFTIGGPGAGGSNNVSGWLRVYGYRDSI